MAQESKKIESHMRQVGTDESRDDGKVLRSRRLIAALSRPIIDITELKKLLWSGVPASAPPWLRGEIWKLALGYLPLNQEMRQQTLERKRKEYDEFIQQTYNNSRRSEVEERLLRQIKVDLPRTAPTGVLIAHPKVQALMERVLYVWAVRHPATGYVQGLNDFLCLFFIVFVESTTNKPYNDTSLNEMPDGMLREIEADAYWSLSKVLSHIQDHYTTGQPGIQRLLTQMKEIVKRVDGALYSHLEAIGADFVLLAFRWMNCLLVRELPIMCAIRLWDTYIAEGPNGFSTFHVYVCAVFLVYWSKQMRIMDFQELMLYIQNLPTSNWSNDEVGSLVSEAYVLQALYHSSPCHLK